MPEEYFVNNKTLSLGKRIGGGGEGQVYLAADNPNLAVKLYKPELCHKREDKVLAMIQAKIAERSQLVAFPREAVFIKGQRFAGFTMSVVKGSYPLHEIYGPKSRKALFPSADFRFLVRVATNTARSIAQVHQSNCVVGDINHSGILVAQDATVALIDADSFQFTHQGQIYPCVVGVPDFTPPELQSVDLSNVIRSSEHDCFGLSVAIFMLLTGRHPYMGKGLTHEIADLSLEEGIRRNLFAYSQVRKTNISPPSFVLTLEDFPDDIADAFERAFGLNPLQRPKPAEWVNLLKGLESKISRCSLISSHFYPSHSKQCPWCKIEAATGAILFPVLGEIFTKGVSAINFNVDRVWAEILAVSLPKLDSSLKPPMTLGNFSPSPAAREAKSKISHTKVYGACIIAAAIIGLFVAPPAAIIWIGIGIFGFAKFNGSSSLDERHWRSQFTQADEAFQNALEAWQDSLGIRKLYDIRNSLEQAVNEYKVLGPQKNQAQAKLQSDRRNRQLTDFLDRYLLRDANIAGLGQAKIATLAMHRIETAADINPSVIMAISGFGKATTDKLVSWRTSLERRFIYNPAPTPSDIQAQNKLEHDYHSKATKLMTQLSSGVSELRQALKPIHQRMTIENSSITKLAQVFEQINHDLEFLGIPKPQRFTKPSYNSRYQANVIQQSTRSALTTQATASTGTVSCPRCGSHMVRRIARKGRNVGHSFWGCSRFPRCKGTRS